MPDGFDHLDGDELVVDAVEGAVVLVEHGHPVRQARVGDALHGQLTLGAGRSSSS